MNGTVLFANAGAAEAVSASCLTIKTSHVCGRSPELTQAFVAFLKRAGNAEDREVLGCVLEDGGRETRLVAHRVRLDPGDRSAPLLLLELVGGSRKAPDTAVLRDLYGLSRAEAELASAFAAGMSLQDYAASHAVSMTTVRTQFARIKAKTGAMDQANVVRLVLQATG